MCVIKYGGRAAIGCADPIYIINFRLLACICFLFYFVICMTRCILSRNMQFRAHA